MNASKRKKNDPRYYRDSKERDAPAGSIQDGFLELTLQPGLESWSVSMRTRLRRLGRGGLEIWKVMCVRSGLSSHLIGQ